MSYSGKWWWEESGKAKPTAPMPMDIPKGYTSGFVEAEMSLIELWQGEKKFLQQFHVKPRNAADKRKENLLGLEFNPDGPKENPGN